MGPDRLEHNRRLFDGDPGYPPEMIQGFNQAGTGGWFADKPYVAGRPGCDSFESDGRSGMGVLPG